MTRGSLRRPSGLEWPCGLPPEVSMGGAAPEAREDLHRSLERLRVDHVDLIQLHSLGHPDDWDQAMGPGGALEALIEAREEGSRASSA